VHWKRPELNTKPELLAAWSSILPRLRRVATERTPGRALDIDAIVHRLGRGEWLASFPKRQHPCWGDQLQVITDRSKRLVPYWTDQDSVSTRLKRYFPKNAVTEARYWDGFPEPQLLTRQRKQRRYDRYQLPPPATLVIVLGDLGAFDRRPYGLLQQWEALGQRLKQAGCRPVALIPGVLKRCPKQLNRYWTVLPWSASTRLVSAPTDKRISIKSDHGGYHAAFINIRTAASQSRAGSASCACLHRSQFGVRTVVAFEAGSGDHSNSGRKRR
jgi:hypothetical protein